MCILYTATLAYEYFKGLNINVNRVNFLTLRSNHCSDDPFPITRVKNEVQIIMFTWNVVVNLLELIAILVSETGIMLYQLLNSILTATAAERSHPMKLL